VIHCRCLIGNAYVELKLFPATQTCADYLMLRDGHRGSSMRVFDRRIANLVFGLIAVFGLWEILGRIKVTGVRVFPSISSIVIEFATSWDLYLRHVEATVETAMTGLAIGGSIGVVAALAFCLMPPLERAFNGVNIALFALPSIALGPLLVLILDGQWPQTVLAAAMVYYPVMSAVLLGLRDVDPRSADLVRAYGGGEGAIMRFVRIRNSIPTGLAGLKIAASVAVLGAILGEFGSGERWGLGTFLLNSVTQANADRLWAISIASAAVALLGYGFFGLLASRFAKSTSQVTIAAARLPAASAAKDWRGVFKNVLMAAVSMVLPFLLWWAVVKVMRLSPIVAPAPLDAYDYVFVGPESAQARSALWNALGQSVPMAAAGMFVGLSVAFLLAAMSFVAPRLMNAILPFAMVLQNTPLVALTPIVLLLFGRGTSASLATAVLVVFFPAYVLLAHGFALVPRAALETVQAYGGGRFKQLVFVAAPFSRRHVLAAAKLVAPRALLGVMVAEWLLTGTGLGHLMDISRGTLDYGMIWSGAVLSIIVSIAAYQFIEVTERLVR
jgi:sulfonate transport system permease protein